MEPQSSMKWCDMVMIYNGFVFATPQAGPDTLQKLLLHMIAAKNGA